MFLSHSSIQSRFSFKPHASKLSALTVATFLGMTSLGWGSLSEEHKKLDAGSIIRWYVTGPNMSELADKKYTESGGTIYKNDSGFSISKRQASGLNRIRIIYQGENDHSLTPLRILDKAEPVTARELGKILGIGAPAYKKFMESLDIPADAPTFPSNLVEGYQFMEPNDLTSRFVRSHSDVESAVWSIAGGPVSALGAVKILIESAQLNHGKPVRFHLNIMGFLPDYSWEFLEILKLKGRMKSIAPTHDGKWFSVLKENLPQNNIDFFINLKAEASRS